MKYLLIIFLSIISFCFSVLGNNVNTPSYKQQSATFTKLPSLGSCDEYTDYFIYKCKPYRCKLQIANYQNVYRVMETKGEENGKCIHNIKFEMRNPHFKSADSYVYCKLSENGKLEMANLFTRYKKGDLKVYTDPMLSNLLKQECDYGK